jgi:two-component system cell cycle response regulator
VAKKQDAGTLFLKKAVTKPAKPKATGDACLILLYPPGPNIGRRTALTSDEYVVGRVSENDIVIDRESVSRRHARLRRSEAEGWVIEDLGSTNGSFVNDVRVSHKPLHDSDQVRIGDAIYKFLSGANVEAAYHEEIYRMTILDGLTGVHNKRYFMEFIERELAASQRHSHPLTLVMFDIDHFKQVNDNRGHLAGDHVLKELAGRIKPRMRREDLLARYGGEEFAAVLNSTGLDGGLKFAEDVRRRIQATPFEFDGESFEVTVSLGVASVDGEQGVEPTTLIARADAKLYEAKNGGRNRVIG